MIGLPEQGKKKLLVQLLPPIYIVFISTGNMRIGIVTLLLVATSLLSACGSYVRDIQIDQRENRLRINGDTTQACIAQAYTAKVEADALVRISMVNANFFKTRVILNENEVGRFNNDSAYKAMASAILTIPKALPRPIPASTSYPMITLDSVTVNPHFDTLQGADTAPPATQGSAVTCEPCAAGLVEMTSQLQELLDFGRHLGTLIVADNYDWEATRTRAYYEARRLVHVDDESENESIPKWDPPLLDSLAIELYNSLELQYANFEKCIAYQMSALKASATPASGASVATAAIGKKPKKGKKPGGVNPASPLPAVVVSKDISKDSAVIATWAASVTQAHSDLEKIGLDSILRVVNASEQLLERIGNPPKNVVLDIRQASGDEMRYQILATTAEGRQDSINFNLFVVNRPKIDFSSGIFVTNLGDFKYYTLIKDSTIHDDITYNTSLRGTIPAELLNVYYRGGWSTQPVEIAASFGLGLDLGSQSARYIAGLSVVIPAYDRRILLTAGGVLGKVKMLSPDLSVGGKYTGSSQIPTADYWRAAWTFGVSYNL